MTGSLATAFRDSALGLVVAVDMVLRTSALAILFFAGSARHGVQDAVGIFLATALIFTLVGIWRIGIRTGLSIVQSEPMAVLLPAAGIIGAASLAPQVAEATSFAVIGLTAIMIGLSFWTVTAFGLERFARLMPHAVVVGFLATTGVLLIMAAFQGLAPSLWNGAAPLALDPKEAVNLGLGISVAALMWGASRVFLRYGVILVIATALGAFYGWLLVSGTTFDAAQNARLLTPSLGGTPDLLYMTHGWRDVDWGVVMTTLPHMAAATLVCVLALLLTVGGIEAIIRKDVPVTRMLRTLGPLNFLAGFAGGGAGYASLASINILSMQQGRSAIAGATICLVMFIAVVQVEWIISYAPNFLTSGLLIFVGFGIIWDWLFTQFRKLILTDWLIAFGIVVISIVLGILAAVAVGLTLAIMIFVVSYARLPMIRSITTLATRRSTVDRGPEQLQYLADHADHVMIVSVQGFLFFGSIDLACGHHPRHRPHQHHATASDPRLSKCEGD
ncbi:SulP family inorganic anion transporter [Roseobacteraceae bacterium S113]